MVSFESLPYFGQGADLCKWKHFGKREVSFSLCCRKGNRIMGCLKVIQQRSERLVMMVGCNLLNLSVQLTTVDFRATLYCHLVLEFEPSTMKTIKRVVLEVVVNPDFDVLLSFAFSSQPSLMQELKTMPQSCADQKLSTRWAACVCSVVRSEYCQENVLCWFCGKWLISISDSRGQCRAYVRELQNATS